MQPTTSTTKKNGFAKIVPPKTPSTQLRLDNKKRRKHNFARFHHQLTSIILYYYILHLETNPRISLKEKEGSNNICNYYLLQNISEPAVPKRKKKKKRNSWLLVKKKKNNKTHTHTSQCSILVILLSLPFFQWIFSKTCNCTDKHHPSFFKILRDDWECCVIGYSWNTICVIILAQILN